MGLCITGAATFHTIGRYIILDNVLNCKIISTFNLSHNRSEEHLNALVGYVDSYTIAAIILVTWFGANEKKTLSRR